MTTQTEKAARFLELHRPGNSLLLPNPWDQGSAKLLASLGFQALATTSSGFAVTLGRSDGSVTRDEALAHAAAIVSATDLPVSADLENGFADDPDGVAHTVSLAVETGLAGLSVEDFSGRDGEPIYDIALAAERVAAAADAAHAGPARPPPAPAPPGPRPWCSPPGAKTICPAGPVWPTPSRACRGSRPRAPTC